MGGGWVDILLQVPCHPVALMSGVNFLMRRQPPTNFNQRHWGETSLCFSQPVRSFCAAVRAKASRPLYWCQDSNVLKRYSCPVTRRLPVLHRVGDFLSLLKGERKIAGDCIPLSAAQEGKGWGKAGVWIIGQRPCVNLWNCRAQSPGLGSKLRCQLDVGWVPRKERLLGPHEGFCRSI